MTPGDVETRLRALFAAAGCDGFVHVRDVDSDTETGLDADGLVVSASVFKVAVALELFRRGALGELDLQERVRVDPATSLRAPSGLSIFWDEAEVSLRDLAVSMLTVSDSLATDVLLERLGIEAVNALTESLGLVRTVIVEDLQSMFERLARDVGFPSWRDLAAYDSRTEDPAGLQDVLERMRSAAPATPRAPTGRRLAR